jgi:hypothetical protein
VLAVLLLLALPSIQAAGSSTGAWGCCVPDTNNDCFDATSGSYSTATDFLNACRSVMIDTNMTDSQVRARMLGYGAASTCTPYRGPGQQCELGCCCETAAIPKTGQQTTRDACTILNAQDPANRPRSFIAGLPTTSCDQVCGGTGTTTTAGYPVSGKVFQKGANTPLAGVTVSLSYAGNTQNTITTSPDGSFKLPNNVPQGQQRFIGVAGPSTVPATCRPSFVDKQITGATTDIRIELDCSTSTCTNPTPSVTAPQVNAAAGSVSFTISLTDTCGTFKDFQVRRCKRLGGVLDPMTCTYFLPSTKGDFSDTSVPAEDVCYIVKSSFSSGSPTATESTPQCINAASAICAARPAGSPAKWCGQDKGTQTVLSCDTTGKLLTANCEAGQSCTESGGNACCINQTACERCNGLGGLFASLPLTLPLGAKTPACAELASTTTPLEQRCYIDAARSDNAAAMIDSYNSCSAVSSCAQYLSKTACEQNLCQPKLANGTPESCRWIVVNDELGKGVCMSKTQPACSQCNSLFGTCTKDVCGRISNLCYFDEQPNGLDPAQLGTTFPRCVAQQDMACRYYDTQADCNGGFSAVFNTQYSADQRSGGDNSLTQPSKDLLNLGVCGAWITDTLSTNSHCIKNADSSPKAKEDDCIELGSTDPNCAKDKTPPVTTLVLRTTGQYGRHEVTSLPFTVADDTTPAAQIKTYFCFDKTSSTAPCYPTQEAGAINPIPVPGTYSLRYYSADANGNLEVVRTASVSIVDAGYATLERVDITQS